MPQAAHEPAGAQSDKPVFSSYLFTCLWVLCTSCMLRTVQFARYRARQAKLRRLFSASRPRGTTSRLQLMTGYIIKSDFGMTSQKVRINSSASARATNSTRPRSDHPGCSGTIPTAWLTRGDCHWCSHLCSPWRRIQHPARLSNK